MLLKTKELLITAAQIERKAGNKSLALFFDRIAKDEIAFVPEVWRGVLTDIHGLPEEIKYVTIDHEAIEEWETVDIYNLLASLSYDKYDDDSSFSKMKEHIQKGVEEWKERFPTSETIEVSITIPSRDLADIKNSLKKRIPLKDKDIADRYYTTAVQSKQGIIVAGFFAPTAERDYKLCWRAATENTSVDVVTAKLEPVKLKIGSVELVCTVDPDPTYE